jgi:hypothetical protein
MNPELDSVFDELVAEMEERVEDWAQRAITIAEQVEPEWAAFPELDEAMRRGARESIFAELATLRHGGQPPDEPPAVDAEGVRLCARFGVPLDVVAFLYRGGHFVQWEGWFDLVEGRNLPAPDRRALLKRGSRFFFAYADRMSRLVTEVYTRERERMLRGQGQRAMHLVREVLDGREVDPAGFDYPLGGSHVAVVAWGAEGADDLRRLADALDRRLLVVAVTEGTWWGWLGGRGKLTDPQRESLRRFEPSSETRLAIGSEAAGTDGFRQSHRRAVMAQRAAAAVERAVVRYEDVAIEAIALRDEEAARDFVAYELRGLDGSDTRSTRLRETLEAYFASGQNAAATAAALRVHEQTVGQRLRAIEERTGRRIIERRAELEVALRLLRQRRAAGVDSAGEGRPTAGARG